MKSLSEVNEAIKKASKMMNKLAKRGSSDIDSALYIAIKNWMEAHAINVNENESKLYGCPRVELIVEKSCCYDELLVFVDLFGEED